MKIIYEIGEKYNIYYLKKVEKKWKIQNKVSLNENNITCYLDELSNIFLLDEKRFKYYSFTYYDKFSKKLDIVKLNYIIDKKIDDIRNIFSEKRRLLYVVIDNIIVNGQVEKFILGKKGDIFFDLRFFYLNEDVYDFFFVYQKDLLDKSLIWPRSFFTLKFINEKLRKRDFYLLYIFEEFILRITVKKGFYFDIKELNLGLSYLRDIFKEKGLERLYYFFILGREIQNLYSKKILLENLDIYFRYLYKWFIEDLYNYEIKDIVMIGNKKIKNEIFVSRLGRNFKNFNIIPFNYSESFSRKLICKDIPIDIQACLYFKG